MSGRRRATRSPLGEQINPLRLVPAEEVQALSFQIPPGLRGYSIPVTTENSPAALLVPGDFVDVLVAGVATSLVTQDTVNNGQPVVVQLGDRGRGRPRGRYAAAERAGAERAARFRHVGPVRAIDARRARGKTTMSPTLRWR